MSARCRADVLALTAGFLDAAVTASALTCDFPAEHTTTVVRKGDGWEVEIHTDVCANHEHFIQIAMGYRRSIKLRTPAPS